MKSKKRRAAYGSKTTARAKAVRTKRSSPRKRGGISLGGGGGGGRRP